MSLRRSIAVLAAAILVAAATAHAGPPYVTDDPEPVEFRHWEFYLATQHSITHDAATGTAPHVEVNYGAGPGLQLHVIAPLAYARPSGGATSYGVGDIELGAKLRFVDEGPWWPMVGTFPQCSRCRPATRLMGWGPGACTCSFRFGCRRSFGAWTTYGGGGLWVNPATGNRNYGYLGWQVQRRLSQLATIGAEVFYTTPDQVGGDANLRFNIGLVLDFTEHHHFLFSAGRGIVGDTILQGYAAYQLTL